MTVDLIMLKCQRGCMDDHPSPPPPPVPPRAYKCAASNVHLVYNCAFAP